jgi:hypothetical protein
MILFISAARAASRFALLSPAVQADQKGFALLLLASADRKEKHAAAITCDRLGLRGNANRECLLRLGAERWLGF